MKKIGLIINPIAGLGGRLGFKGTDGAIAARALAMGAELVAPSRARLFLNSLSPKYKILAPPGKMGLESVHGTPHEDNVEVVNCVGRRTWPTVAADTKRCALAMLDEGVDLLVFVGGDGTARDILDSIGVKLPALGVPSGVKMYSAVFAVNPRAAARIAEDYLEGLVDTDLKEVVDVDEEAFRRDELVIRVYGYLKVPQSELLVGIGKQPSGAAESSEAEAIAEYIVEGMENCTLYILGPGTTTAAIARRLGVEKTLLGVDAIHNGRLVGKDLNEAQLLEILDVYRRAFIIVSPLGGQGFLFGRGNQQISPEVIRRVGVDNIIIVATKAKLSRLKTLRVDTGDDEVDAMLRGYRRVIVGYGEERVVRVE